MMQLNPEIDKWISASVARHLSDLQNPSRVHLHVQNSKDETSDKTEWFELYLDITSTNSHNMAHYYVDVYVGCITKLENEVFAMSSLTGKARALLCKPIHIRKWASGTENPECIGTLQFRDDLKKSLDGVNFGTVIDKTIPVQRATVEAHFEMFLTVEL